MNLLIYQLQIFYLEKLSVVPITLEIIISNIALIAAATLITLMLSLIAAHA
jgi:hypothetical protein